MIKIYRKGVHPRFPDGGIMTQYLESLDQGAQMLMAGPKGRLAYQGFGNFLLSNRPVNKKKIGLIAGGTGITPCYQVLQAALDGNDGTKLWLLFANRSVEDILLRDELDQYAYNFPENLKIHYTVDVQPQTEWKYSVGWVNPDMMKANLPEPAEDTIILYCGPPPFEDMLKKNLVSLGYAESMMFKF